MPAPDPLNWTQFSNLLMSVRFDLMFSQDAARVQRLREIVPQCFKLPEEGLVPVSLAALVEENQKYWAARQVGNMHRTIMAATEFRPACETFDIPVVADWRFDWEETGPIPEEILDQLAGKKFTPGMEIRFANRSVRIVWFAHVNPLSYEEVMQPNQVMALSLIPGECLSEL